MAGYRTFGIILQDLMIYFDSNVAVWLLREKENKIYFTEILPQILMQK
jgi:hypothetical protein